MINIENLHKKFGKLKVLDGLDVQVEQGEVFAILGPNGSGKTTLIKCILGMVLPDSGTITIDGHSIKNKWQYRKDIDYLPQIANFPANLSVKELFRMIQDLRGRAGDDETLIDRFALRPYLDKKLGTLSGGTKQKVNIVLTFMFDSSIIILDEPTTGLDPVALVVLKQLIEEEKQKGKTILITSHIMSFVEEMAEGIIFILDGKIYFKGSTKMLMEDTQEHNLEHAMAKILKNTYV